MSYIGRFFSWMIRGIIQLIQKTFKWFIMWTIRQITSFIRFGWPYLWWIIWSALGLALQLSILHLLALLKGALSVSQDAGRAWAHEACKPGSLFPNYHETSLARILTVVAFLAIISGYIINFFTAFFIVDYTYQWLITR